jgi:hypothetical protein
LADADVGLGVGVAGTLSIGWPLSLPGRGLGGLGGAGMSGSGKVLHEALVGLDGGRSHLLQVSSLAQDQFLGAV